MPVGETRHGAGPSRRNLFRVWSIRSILILALLALSAYLRWFSHVELPWRHLFTVLLAAGAVNGLLLYRLRLAWPVSEPEFFANLLLDVLFLTAVLYLSGGSTNPLVSYYLIPLFISAAILRARLTWVLAILTVGCYTALFFHFRPFELFATSGHGTMMGAHFLGMWVNFVFSAALIAWFVVRMGATLREQDRAISRFREEGMRNEQIIGAASIAAGAAHELRTPLATMTVLADELQNDHPALAEEMALLQGQLDRCNAILGELVSTTGEGAGRTRVAVAELLTSIRDKWRLTRPEVPLEVRLPPDCGTLKVEVDPSFTYAALNFLNNAADASPRDVRLEVLCDGDQVLMAIEDRGPGIPPEIAESLGKRYISRKVGGLGLGVLLSCASIERLDGTVALLDREGGGTRLEIRLPPA